MQAEEQAGAPSAKGVTATPATAAAGLSAAASQNGGKAIAEGAGQQKQRGGESKCLSFSSVQLNLPHS
jgi:hypothetical protein